MKYNTNYRFAKQCAEDWSKGDGYTEAVFLQLKSNIEKHPDDETFRLFLKCLRKIDKPLWHLFVD